MKLNSKQKIIVCVSNDLSTDQRVQRVCSFLVENNFEVYFVGRRLKNSLSVNSLPFKTKRFRLLFNKGALFYGALNFRLFFYILFHKCDVVTANDLDTLPAVYLALRIKRKTKLVFDAHEIFCEVPELMNSPSKKKVWLRIEKKIMPGLNHFYTVNQSISDYFFSLYKVKSKVVRNISNIPATLNLVSREELGLPKNKFIGIIQGSGINKDRGNEEIIEAYSLLDESHYLLICGNGNVIEKLKLLVMFLNISHRVCFKPRMQYSELLKYTSCADIGFSMDKPTNLNYCYSLPNKFFDFVHCKTPVISSGMIEISKLTTYYNCGITVNSINAKEIANTIHELQKNGIRYNQLVEGCKKASTELTWENEKKILREIYL